MGGGDTNEIAESAARTQVRSEGVCGVETGDGRYLDFIPKVVGSHHTLKKGGPSGER